MNDKNKFNDFDEVFIEKKYKDSNEVAFILGKLKNGIKIHIIKDPVSLIKETFSSDAPVDKAKKLLLTGLKGKVLKKCPGSLGHLCCNYYVVNLYLGCPINCSYCILQAYLKNPFITINVNILEIFEELDKILSKNKNKHFRIGTGELGDSLVYDPITGFSEKFIDFFSNYKNATFEFKTKTDYIENILKHDSPGNIVVGFSVNAQQVTREEEGLASSLEERLIAAQKAVKKGYHVSFHFDPIVHISDYKKEYFEVIRMIFEYVKPHDIAWVSLGTMRYTKELKKNMKYNYPETELLSDEFIECRDEKYRYFKPVRSLIYSQIIGILKKYDKSLPVYLCMESPEVWKSSMGFLPSKKNLGSIF